MMKSKNKSLRVLLVDDEVPSLWVLREFLENDRNIEIIGECTDGKGAVRAIEKHSPDVVFLDIQMPGMSGFDVIKEVGIDKMPEIVFVTAFRRHAVEAFEIHAFDYLVKPILRKRVNETVSRLLDKFAQEKAPQMKEKLGRLLAEPRLLALLGGQEDQDESTEVKRIAIEHQGKIIQILCKEIDWIESQQQYVELHSMGKSYLYSSSLSNLEILLGEEFLRIHRGYIVNCSAITEVKSLGNGRLELILRDNTKLQVSRRKKSSLRKIFDQLAAKKLK